MRLLLAYRKVYHCYNKDYAEEDKCSRTCSSLLSVDGIVNKSDHRIESTCVTRRSHILAEYTDDARILLEAADKARYYNVCDHRRKERNGDLGEHAETARTVDLSGVIVLLVNALESAEKDKDLEGERVPYDVDRHNGDICGISRACIYPVNGISAEELNYVVYNSCRNNKLIFAAEVISDHVEHCREYHTDSDGVCYVRKEVNCLKESRKRSYRVKAHCYDEREDRRDRHSQHAEKDRIEQTVLKVVVLNDLLEVVKAVIELIADVREGLIISLLNRHMKRIDNRPDGKYQKKYDSGGKIQPRFPLMLTFYHITPPQK